MAKYKDCCPYCGQATPHADFIRDTQHSIDEAIKDLFEANKKAEQGLQQVKQIAKDVYDDAWATHFLRANDLFPELSSKLKEQIANGELEPLRNKLKELGVDIDD